MENRKRERSLPGEEECELLWQKYGTPARVQAHCRAVRSQALALGEQVKKNGHKVDLELIAAAALLHDLVRHEKNHAAAGAGILAREGYLAVAEIVACHHDFKDEDWEKEFAREAAIVYLADKQIQGEDRVNIWERFEKSRKRCEMQENAKEALYYHQIRWEQAKAVEQYVESLLH